MKKLILILLSVFVGTLLSVGCVYKSGNQRIADDKLVEQIEVGKSTKADVERLLGRPISITKTAFDGTAMLSLPLAGVAKNQETWLYTCMQSRVDGRVFIPYAGFAFVNKTNVLMCTVAVSFNEAGVVASKMSSHNQTVPEGLPPQKNQAETTAE